MKLLSAKFLSTIFCLIFLLSAAAPVFLTCINNVYNKNIVDEMSGDLNEQMPIEDAANENCKDSICESLKSLPFAENTSLVINSLLCYYSVDYDISSQFFSAPLTSPPNA